MIIPYIKTTFIIEPEEELNLPYFKGSTFRGVFGNVFRKIVCTLKRQTCEECLLKQSCIYSYIFETSPTSEKAILNMHKYKSIPHPFIIEPPLHNGKIYKKGDEISFSIIIVGKAIDYLPYFIYTFTKCGELGIGKGRGKFILKKVLQNEKIIYDYRTQNIYQTKKEIFEIKEDINPLPTFPDTELSLEILTPIRIKHERKLVSNLEFYILIKTLMLRLNLLHFFHCFETEAKWDYKNLLEFSKSIKIKKSNLRWFDWQRYSSRQNTKMSLGGVIGSITYEGKIEPYLEILKAGEIFHVGKNTSFGLGKYIIKAKSEL